MKKLLSFIFVLTALTVNAATIVDELTTSSFKIPGTKSSPYALFSATGTSGAEYKVFAYGTNGQNIQVNTSKSGIGIVTTASSKYVKSVTITMGKNDKEYATSIYASNTAYSDPADLKTAVKVTEVKTSSTTHWSKVNSLVCPFSIVSQKCCTKMFERVNSSCDHYWFNIRTSKAKVKSCGNFFADRIFTGYVNSS